jgi:hypothetical protein
MKNSLCFFLEGNNAGLFEEFIQILFHIFIPQAIDHGIQHGKCYSVTYGNYFVCIKRIARLGARADVENRVIA